MKTTYLLGAGFSRAVNGSMPLMRDLSQAVADRASSAALNTVAELSTFRHDFEAWLTHLSTEQPWLSQSENLRNNAAFLEVSETVSQIIRESQNAAFEQPVPPWLTVLENHWDTNDSTVITFNYDEIPESAANELLPGPGAGT